MNVIEYSENHVEEVKDLLVELQEYLASLDKRGVIILKDNYREEYFSYTMTELQKHNGKIFMAESTGRAIGIIVCKIFQGGGESEYTTSRPKIGFISDLVVTKEDRGKGVGKVLLKRAEDYFAEYECEYMQFEVFAPNTDAFEFYKKSGYEINCMYLSKKCKRQI